MACSGEGRDRAAADSAAEGGARLRAGGERGAQSQPRRHCSRAPNSGGGGEAGGRATPRPPARARAPVASRPPLRLAARPVGGKSSPGAERGRGGGLPSWSETDGARGLARRRPRVSGGRRRGTRRSGRRRRRKRPRARPAVALAVALAVARRAVGASGRRGQRGGRGSECGRWAGLGGGRNRFRGNPASPAAPNLPGNSGPPAARPASCGVGPGPAGRCWVEGRPPFALRAGHGWLGDRAGVVSRSAARSAPRPGRSSPRSSRSCGPGRPGRRRAPPCSERPGFPAGKSEWEDRQRFRLLLDPQARPVSTCLSPPPGEAPWTRGLSHRLIPEPGTGSHLG